MEHKKALITITAILISLVLFSLSFIALRDQQRQSTSQSTPETLLLTQTPSPNTIIPTLAPVELPQSYIIPLRSHSFQTFNNCGPAALSMQLSYFDVEVSQQTLGQKLRPYQNSAGINDDKSVTLEELAQEATQYSLISYHRPAGSVDLLKQFVASDIPVVVRTWTTPTEDIGHYRLVRGYDQSTREFIQDDSLQGKDLRIGYDDFIAMWQPFNFEFLVIAEPNQRNVVESLLAQRLDEQSAWEHATAVLEEQLATDPNNMHALFNLSVAQYHLDDFEKSIKYYEQVENRLPFRTLWYQIETIQAYYETGEHDRVFEITNRILEGGNKAFSELYEIRAQVYRKQGNEQAAQEEENKALLYKNRP